MLIVLVVELSPALAGLPQPLPDVDHDEASRGMVLDPTFDRLYAALVELGPFVGDVKAFLAKTLPVSR